MTAAHDALGEPQRRRLVVAHVFSAATMCGGRLFLEVVGAQRKRSSTGTPSPGEEEIALAASGMPAFGREDERHGRVVAVVNCSLPFAAFAVGQARQFRGCGRGLLRHSPGLLLLLWRLALPSGHGRTRMASGLPALGEEDAALPVSAGDERAQVVAEGIFAAALSLQVERILDEGEAGVVQTHRVLRQERHQQLVTVADLVVHLLVRLVPPAKELKRGDVLAPVCRVGGFCALDSMQGLQQHNLFGHLCRALLIV